MKSISFLKYHGYMCFPLADINKKCELVDTYTLYSKDKKTMKAFKATRKILKHTTELSICSDIIWQAIKEEKLDKEFKGCWLVPLRITEMSEELMIDVDILKPIKPKMRLTFWDKW